MESEELQMDDVLGTKELSGNCQGTVKGRTGSTERQMWCWVPGSNGAQSRRSK